MVTALAVVVACSATGSDNDVDPKPDPVGSSSGAGGNNTGGDAGTGGSGANSSGSGGNPGYTSGSRLKARRLIGDDGAEHFYGWHDSMLGVECSPAKATDGQIRCLPFGYNAYLFVDAACSNAIVHVGSTCTNAASGHARRATGNPCDPDNEVRAVQGSIAAPPQVWLLSDGNCIESGVPSTGSFYALGPAMSPDQFVAMNEQIDP